jgi:hypothetical protein
LPAEFAPVLITDGEEVTAAMRVNTTGEDWFGDCQDGVAMILN